MVCFSFHDAPTTEIYTLSLHDALPICQYAGVRDSRVETTELADTVVDSRGQCPLITYVQDRKSTRLNSSHVEISYAVFCLKKKTFAHGMILVARGTYGRLLCAAVTEKG